MKYIQILLLIILYLPRAACAQYVSFTKENNGTNTISIPNGKFGNCRVIRLIIRSPPYRFIFIPQLILLPDRNLADD